MWGVPSAAHLICQDFIWAARHAVRMLLDTRALALPYPASAGFWRMPVRAMALPFGRVRNACTRLSSSLDLRPRLMNATSRASMMVKSDVADFLDWEPVGSVIVAFRVRGLPSQPLRYRPGSHIPTCNRKNLQISKILL